MDNLIRYFSGGVMALAGMMAPVRPLITCAIIFVAIDFITGVWASNARARKESAPWGFESSEARRTVYKLIFIMGGIVLAWLIDSVILGHIDLRLANLFTGFVCGVEFWSYLENAAEISNHPIFKWLRKFMKNKITEGLDADHGQLNDEENYE